jgi:heme/copper-type cytochrome/quinol oxidase subunit 2
MAQGAVDRRAETREAVQRANPEPNNDTAPIPLSVLAPRRVPADPLVAQSETFGPHTTAASQRKVKTRSTFLMLAGAIVVVAMSLVTLTVWRHHVAAARAPSAPSTSERATGTAVVTLPVAADPSVASSTVGVATTQATDGVKPSAPAVTHKTPPPSTVTTTTQATAAPPPTTSTHRRPGSGL